MRYKFYLLFALHLALSLAFVFLAFPLLGEATSGLDPDGYGAAGLSWWQTGRFEPINRAPLYPGFVALVSWLAGGYQLAAIQVGQCLLSAFGILILYAIFRRTLIDERTAWVAGLACAVYPMTLWYIPRLWTETFLTFGLALFTLSLVALIQQPTSLRAVLAGCAAGFIALSKGIALAFLPSGVVIIGVGLRSQRLKLGMIFALAALAWVLPWTVRNWNLTGAFLPIHTDGGYNSFLGNGFTRHFWEAPGSYVELKRLTVEDMDAVYRQSGAQPEDPVEVDRVLLRAGLAEIIADPLLVVRKVITGAVTFWYLAGDWSKSLLTGALQIPVLLAALPGTWLAFKERRRSRLLLVPVLGIFGVSVAVFSFARLSAPVMPYMIALAVEGLFGRRQLAD